MSDEEGFQRKGRRMAAIEAAKRIKKNAEENAQKNPLYQKIKDQDFDSLEFEEYYLRNSPYGNVALFPKVHGVTWGVIGFFVMVIVSA
ncbi:hypothetical protein QVD17_12382 [Tagetes erecta]|uniref:Uncharacterized protein n=1 Tax=Tagetes erecta TaxID=13708 RepID=A0AAD8L116_TARER|nr:hypothetical protein QVD17_12382 [Tagetes erecta]